MIVKKRIRFTKKQRRDLIKRIAKRLWPIIEASAKKSLERYLEEEFKNL